MSRFLLVLRLVTAGMGLACAVILCFRRRAQGSAGRVEDTLLFPVLLLHIVLLGCRAYVLQFFPLQSIQDVLVLFSLMILAIYRFGGRSLRRAWIGIPIYMISAVLIVLSALGDAPSGTPPELRSVMVLIHVVPAFVAYACLTLNFVLCIHLAVQSARRRTTDPASLGKIERASRRFAWVGFAFYGVFVLGMGMVWAKIAWGRFWGWDPKETLSLVTFCVYALYLYFEFVIKPKSRALRTSLAAAAYATLILTFIFGMSIAGLHDHT